MTEQELARAKKKLLGKQAIAHQSNASLAYTAALDELYGLGYLSYKAMAVELEAVTLEQTREGGAPVFPRPSVRSPSSARPETVLPPAELTRRPKADLSPV